MIRATTFLIVLTLAGTPTATSLCIAWCPARTSPGAEGAGCHHEAMTLGGTPRLVAREHACDELLQGVPFVKEDLQGVASGSAADDAVVAAHHSLGHWEAGVAPAAGARGQPHAFRPSDSSVLRL